MNVSPTPIRGKGTSQERSPLKTWLAEPLPTDVSVALDRISAAEDVKRVAVMPDVHLCREVCVGTVVATSRSLYPQAVGGDIGCGMAALRFECEAEVLRDERVAARVLSGLYTLVPSQRHSRRSLPNSLPDELVEMTLTHPYLEKLKLDQRSP